MSRARSVANCPELTLDSFMINSAYRGYDKLEKNMFDLLKKFWERLYFVYWKWKIGVQASKWSIKYDQDIAKYKILKNTDLSDIPDKELEWAVEVWLTHGKFTEVNGDWIDAYEVVASLPKPCQDVYSTIAVTQDVMNGGFYQLFANPSGQFAEMSIDGFIAIGSPKLSDLVKKAMTLYQQNKQIVDVRYDAVRDAMKDGISQKNFYEASPNELDTAFTELNEAFFAYDDAIDYAKYIRQNADCFGD